MILLKKDVTPEQIEQIIDAVANYGLKTYLLPGATGISILQLIGEEHPDLRTFLPGMDGVEQFVPVQHDFKLINRQHHPEYSKNGNTRIVVVGDVRIGGDKPVVIAGPCTVYTLEQVIETAKTAKEAGAQMLRGGAYKPRTSPHSFRGLKEDGLKILAEARAATGLPIVTEVLDPRDVETTAKYADMLQIGTRNAQNHTLIEEAAGTMKPILLKRGFGNDLKEWLCSAEYAAAQGNLDIVLCERGIRTLSNPDAGRFTLDIQVIGRVRELTYLPIIADPSHSAGRESLVQGNSIAALEAGAHGLEIDIMRENEQPTIRFMLNGTENFAGYVDYAQGLRPQAFKQLMRRIKEQYALISSLGHS